MDTTNLKPRHTRDGKRCSYSHYSGETGPVVKITLSHRDGGANMFSGRSEKRGIEVMVKPVTLEDQGRGVVMESSMLFADDGTRLLVTEQPRYSARKLETVARAFDANVPEIARLWGEDRAAATRLLMDTAEAARRAA